MKRFTLFFCTLLSFFLWKDAIAQKYTFNNVGQHASFLEDVESTIEIQSLLRKDTTYRFQQNELAYLNFHTTYSSFWVKLPVRAIPGKHDYIELASPFLDEVKFYQVSAQGEIVYSFITGDDFPFLERPLRKGTFSFPIDHEAGGTLYIRINCIQALYSLVRTWEADELLSFTEDFNFTQGLYFGFLLLMFFYNFFIYLSTREPAYLFYVSYVLALTFFMGAVQGYTFEYFWPDTPAINKFTVIIPAITQILAVLFSKSFLKTELLSKFMRKALNVYIGWGGVVIILTFIGLKIEALVLVQVGMLTIGFTLIGAGVLSYRRGYAPAKYYLLAWCFVSLGFISAIAEGNGVFTPSTYLNSIQIGSSLEVLFLSFALGDRINTYRREKEKLARLEAEQKAELEINRLEQEKLQLQIDRKNREMLGVSSEMANKRDLITQLSSMIEKMEKGKVEIKEIKALLRESLKANQEFDSFKVRFEEIHPDFFNSLSEMYPKLTSHDLHLCAYIKMRLSNQEIASLMNITPASLKNGKYRLKKKMGLAEGITIENVLAKL